MNWRTDKPSANVIVAFIGRTYPRVLVRDEKYDPYVYSDTFGIQFTEEEIERWADLEEDETVTDCNGEAFDTEVYLYCQNHFEELTSDRPTQQMVAAIARHFAKWGAEHLKK